MCIGAFTSGVECENSLQGEKDCNSRLRFVRVCWCSSLCFCDSEETHILAKSLAVATTLQENCIPGYKPVDSSVGILSPGTQARIIREDGTDGGVGEPGELWVKGESISRGYFNDEEATARTFTKDGWLKTGDIFTIDEKGNL